MRQCRGRRDKLELQVFDRREDAVAAHARLQAAQQSERRGGGGSSTLHVPPHPPPAMQTAKILLDIRHSVSPQKFWVSLVERREDLARLNRLLAEASRAAQRAPVQILPGQVYLASYGGDKNQGLVLYR